MCSNIERQKYESLKKIYLRLLPAYAATGYILYRVQTLEVHKMHIIRLFDLS